ncbi:MAG: VanZ family protein [Burkholderiaceae bacterium]|nr:VanZ family protein [Burkholderiaceae bacterium]
MPPTTATTISRATYFFRASLLVYLLLIVYASWYPFSGWRDTGVSPLAYVTAPWPRYWTGFDLATNVAAYVPLGALAVFALHPKVRGWHAALIALASCTALSLLMEAVQTFLPTRVASNLDLMTNTTGAAVGAAAGVLLAPSFLAQGRFHQLAQRWFRPDSSRALIVLALWPLAQIFPQSWLFGHGQLLPILSGWLSSLLDESVNLGALLRQLLRLNIDRSWQYWLLETIITACGLTGALLALLCLLRRSAPRMMLTAALLALAIGIKTLAIALLFAPENAFVWLTPGALCGVLIGMMMVSGLAFAPAIVQRRLAAIALLINLAVVNLTPANHYFIATLEAWSQGKFLNFNGAAQFLALCWPLLALYFLLQQLHHPALNE